MKVKKIVLTLVCIFAAVSGFAGKDDDRPVQVSQLPQTAQEFIKKNFSGIKVALAKMESDFFDKSYKVIFTNGNKVEFDRNGKWKKIECRYTEVPASAIPVFIRKHISESYPGVKVWKLEYYKGKKRKYEVKLSNRWELEFDYKGNLLDIDRD